MNLRSSTFDSVRSHIERLLKVQESHKPHIYTASFEAAEIADLNYWLQLFLSAGIATLGLVQNSAAVIIGAMLVSPLMGPIIATGLALALGDFYLGLKSLLNVVASVAAAVLFAAGIVWALPFQSVTPEILARTQPNLLDLAIAIFSGLAGAVVACRGGEGGGVTALPGVAVAVALMPPLCVVGFGVGSGPDWSIMRGGGLLFLTNLVAIVGSSFFTFFVVRMDAPEVRGQINEWLEERGQGERLYALVQHTAFRRLLGKVGSLPRRALILLIFLVTIYVPLRSALERLREETMARGVVRSELRRAIAAGSLVSQQVDLGPQAIHIRIVATDSIPADKIGQLKSQIAARTGRTVNLIVQEVARREDVVALGRRLSAVPVTVPELESARVQILSVIESALAAAWPQATAPLAGYSLNLRPSGLQLHLAYLADLDLGAGGQEAVRRAVESRAGAKMDFSFERLDPRINVFRWRAGARRPPANSQAALLRVSEAVRRFPILSCRIHIPKARPELGETLVKELEAQGVERSRLQVESSGPEEPWAYVSLQARQP